MVAGGRKIANTKINQLCVKRICNTKAHEGECGVVFIYTMQGCHSVGQGFRLQADSLLRGVYKSQCYALGQFTTIKPKRSIQTVGTAYKTPRIRWWFGNGCCLLDVEVKSFLTVRNLVFLKQLPDMGRVVAKSFKAFSSRVGL